MHPLNESPLHSLLSNKGAVGSACGSNAVTTKEDLMCKHEYFVISIADTKQSKRQVTL